jgi:hypothetical protein
MNASREVSLQRQHSASGRDVIQRRTTGLPASRHATITQSATGPQSHQPQQPLGPAEEDHTTVADTRTYSVPIKSGVAIIVAFLGNVFVN